MTTMQHRLREETEREPSPWELAYEQDDSIRSWEYICRDGSYVNRERIDYTRISVLA
jgi:hypothetical protein